MHPPEKQKDMKKCDCEVQATSARLPGKCMTCGHDVA